MKGRYDSRRRRYVLDLSHEDMDFIIEELPSSDGTTRYLLALQAESACDFADDVLGGEATADYCYKHQAFCPESA